MGISTLCPFCGKEIGKFAWSIAVLYHHDEFFPSPACDAYITFCDAPNVSERFSRRDEADDDKCPFCGGTVALTNTNDGDTHFKCLNPDCAALFYFGRPAFMNEDRKPIYTADEALQKFKKRSLRMKNFNIGDKVVMNDKYSVPLRKKGKVFVVESKPWECCGTMVVKLSGESGGYAVDGLDRIDNDVQETSDVDC